MFLEESFLLSVHCRLSSLELAHIHAAIERLLTHLVHNWSIFILLRYMGQDNPRVLLWDLHPSLSVPLGLAGHRVVAVPDSLSTDRVLLSSFSRVVVVRVLRQCCQISSMRILVGEHRFIYGFLRLLCQGRHQVVVDEEARVYILAWFHLAENLLLAEEL